MKLIVSGNPQHVSDVVHPSGPRGGGVAGERPAHVSANSGRFLPSPGHGLVYGTNRGHLIFCRPGWGILSVCLSVCLALSFPVSLPPYLIQAAVGVAVIQVSAGAFFAIFGPPPSPTGV